MELIYSNRRRVFTWSQGRVALCAASLRACALVVYLLIGFLLIGFLLIRFLPAIANDASAQVSVVGSLTSTSATTPAALKTFFDSGSNNHWVFWYTAVQAYVRGGAAA